MESAEDPEEIKLGLKTIKDYSWKELLDMDACTSCGRCQDVCPAYITGKPLSPKWLILDSRNHALALHSDRKLVEKSILPENFKKLDSFLIKNLLLKTSNVNENIQVISNDNNQASNEFSSSGTYRSQNNSLTQKSVLKIGGNVDARIAGEVIDQDVFWSCTTCMACVEECPVGINHVDQIIGNRRNMALMYGEIPTEAQNTLKSIENKGNPFGNPADRIDWIKGLDVKILKEGDSVDYLYWVGCVSAFDKRKQKIAQSLVKIMNKANLSFGILGEVEGCTGDPARRLGEENLFQTMAKKNIDILKGIRFKTLVANCPHCFNTIKNEYPEFGNIGNGIQPEIIHHSVLLRKLLENGTIIPKENSENKKFTFHDPCYLGRYNDEYEAPRRSITAIKGFEIVEMEQNKK